jgi:hypothetical protein
VVLQLAPSSAGATHIPEVIVVVGHWPPAEQLVKALLMRPHAVPAPTSVIFVQRIDIGAQ